MYKRQGKYQTAVTDNGSETMLVPFANELEALVFSQFVDHLKIVEERLKTTNITYQYLDGSTPRKKRTERVDAFQSGQGDVLLISLTAGALASI